MRHYLTLKTGEIPNLKAVYEAFKSHARSPEVAAAGVDPLVADIHTYAGYYCAMALDKEPHRDLAQVFRDLRELKVDVAYPFLLELYDDHVEGRLSTEDFVQAVRLVEAHVFRRAVCAIPTNSLNKTFATFGRAVLKDRYLESIQAHLLTLPSYRRFPSDEEFKRELSARDLYSFPRRSYWLRRLENFGRKERVPVDEFTIEHIMPQNENLSAKWREALGSEWERVQKTWLHTLGNLTLTGYNAEYSDRPFAEKRDMPGGFKVSPLRLNEGLGTLAGWDETTIQERAKRLADQAVKVWAPPTLTPDVLETYRRKSNGLPATDLRTMFTWPKRVPCGRCSRSSASWSWRSTPVSTRRSSSATSPTRPRPTSWTWCRRRALYPGFPFCLPRMASLYIREPPSARNFVRRTIVQLQRPSPQPALTCDRLEPPAFRAFSQTPPHTCALSSPCGTSLHSSRVSLPARVAPKSFAACRRTAAGSDALLPAGASSTAHASPAGPQFSPAAAGDW